MLQLMVMTWNNWLNYMNAIQEAQSCGQVATEILMEILLHRVVLETGNLLWKTIKPQLIHHLILHLKH